MLDGVGYIIPIVTFSILFNLVKFFEIETIYIAGEVYIYNMQYMFGTNSYTMQIPRTVRTFQNKYFD